MPRIFSPLDNLVMRDATLIVPSSYQNGFSANKLKDQARARRWRSDDGWWIVAGLNDEIYFENVDGKRVAFIAPGYYATGTALATAITTAMAVGGYSPLDAFTSARLEGWYRGDSVSLDANGYVSAWNDLSGAARNLAQATAANRPLWFASAADGRPGLYFHGDAQLVSSALGSAFLGANGVGTMVCVFKLDSDAAATDDLVRIGSSSEYAVLYYNGGNAGADAYDTSTKTATKAVAGGGLSVLHHAWWRYDQTNLSCFADDADTANGTHTAMTGALHANVLGGLLYVGGYSGSGNPTKGHLMEVMIFSSALNEGEREGLTQYLRGRYPTLVANDTTTAVTWSSTNTATYSGTTNKFTIARTAGAGILSLMGFSATPAIAKAAAAFPDIGFSTAADKTGATSYVADNAAYQGRHAIKFDLGAASTVLAAAVMDWNGTGTLTLQGNSSDEWSAPAFSQVLSAASRDAFFATFASTSLRYWRLVINDVTNPVGYSELSHVFLGDYVTVPAYANGFANGYDDLSNRAYTRSGALLSDELPQRDIFGLRWPGSISETKDAFITLRLKMALGVAFYFQFDEVYDPTDWMYSELVSPIVTNHIEGSEPEDEDLWDISATLREVI